MARITLVIEDSEEGGASVKWDSDTGYVAENGTQAEQIAFDLIRLLALAGGVNMDSMTVKSPSGEAN